MKNKNILLCLIYLLVLICVALFNYIQDPYGVFNPGNRFILNGLLLHSPYTQIKLSKNQKYKYLIIGGSPIRTMNLSSSINTKEGIADISTMASLDFADMEKLLHYWLYIHPETEVIFFPIDIHQFDFQNSMELFPLKKKDKILTLKELYFLFLSVDTTKHSLFKILKIKNNDNEYKYTNIDKHARNKKNKVDKYDYNTYSLLSYSRLYKKIKKENYRIVYYTPPADIDYLYKNYSLGKKINKVLRLTTGDNYIINFLTKNQLTTQGINNKDYFIDKAHPTELYGLKVAQVLFSFANKNEKEAAEKCTIGNLCTIINKNNTTEFIQEIEKEAFVYSKQIKKFN